MIAYESLGKSSNFTETNKKTMKQHPIVFNLFNVSKKEIMTNILIYKLIRLIASGQCCWGAIFIATILTLNP